MNYYYGTAFVTIQGDVKVRVNPNEIEGDNIKKCEMSLPHGRFTGGKTIMEYKWTPVSPQGPPYIIGGKITLNIDGVNQTFQFRKEG